MNKILSWFCYIFLKPIVKLIWIKEIRGLENLPKENFILASNHQSHWDQVTNAFICVPRRFTYLGQVDQYTGFAGFLRNFFYLLAGVIPVDRLNPESKKRAIEECVKRIKRGEILIMYPEGTRTRTGEMLSPKPGIGKIYLETQVPILPVAIKGNFEILPPSSFFPKFKKIVKINIGKPLEFNEEIEIVKNLDCQSEEYKKIAFKIAETVMEKIRELYLSI